MNEYESDWDQLEKALHEFLRKTPYRYSTVRGVLNTLLKEYEQLAEEYADHGRIEDLIKYRRTE